MKQYYVYVLWFVTLWSCIYLDIIKLGVIVKEHEGNKDTKLTKSKSFNNNVEEVEQRAMHSVNLVQDLRQISMDMINDHGRWSRVTAAADDVNWLWVSEETTGSSIMQNNNDTGPSWGKNATLMVQKEPQQLPSNWTATLTGNRRVGQHNTTQALFTTSFPRKMKVAMYGTSHIRELFLEMERLHYNITSRKTCNDQSWHNRKECHEPTVWADLMDREPVRPNSNCMPYNYLYSLGSRSNCSSGFCAQHNYEYDGIDLNRCGPPGFRSFSVEEDLSKVAVGFKTYIHTPEAEELFLKRLSSVNMRKVDVAIVEMGNPWGPRSERIPPPGTSSPTTGNKKNVSSHLLLKNMTMEDEIKYYVHWVKEVAFPDTLIIWVTACGCTMNGGGLAEGIDEMLSLVKREDERDGGGNSIILDKRHLCKKRPRSLSAGHGCAGDVLNVLGRMVLQLLAIVEEKTR